MKTVDLCQSNNSRVLQARGRVESAVSQLVSTAFHPVPSETVTA